MDFSDIVKKEIAKATREPIMQARKESVFSERGRIFLDAAAMLYEASVNSDGILLDKDGNVMTKQHPDYDTIVSMAQQQAMNESSIGSDILGS